MARRIVRIRLDAACENPNLRTGFKHPRLKAWVRENRGGLVRACLVLVRAWVAAGKPVGESMLGSYENWAAVLGGILGVAGVPGFLSNWVEMAGEVNSTDGAWRAMVGRWWERYRDTEVSGGDVYTLLADGDIDINLKPGTDQSRLSQLGFMLKKQVGKVYAGFRIERAAPNSHRNANGYRLRQVGGDGLAVEALAAVVADVNPM
jgi:putative DNA primase/helicase